MCVIEFFIGGGGGGGGVLGAFSEKITFWTCLIFWHKAEAQFNEKNYRIFFRFSILNGV